MISPPAAQRNQPALRLRGRTAADARAEWIGVIGAPRAPQTWIIKEPEGSTIREFVSCTGDIAVTESTAIRADDSRTGVELTTTRGNTPSGTEGEHQGNEEKRRPFHNVFPLLTAGSGTSERNLKGHFQYKSNPLSEHGSGHGLRARSAMNVGQEQDKVLLVVRRSHVRTTAVVAVGVVAGLVLFLAARGLLPARSDSEQLDAEATALAWEQAPRFEIAVEGRPARGNEDAAVTLVEFTDYGCPHCRRFAAEVLPEILRQYGEEMRHVARHFPIPALTPNGLMAAQAAECAYKQGYFWDYRDILMRGPSKLSEEQLREHATATGLQLDAFEQCVQDAVIRQTVERDILDAWNYGVTGTPTFFINGRRFRGYRSYPEFAAYIQFAIAEAGSGR